MLVYQLAMGFGEATDFDEVTDFGVPLEMEFVVCHSYCRQTKLFWVTSVWHWMENRNQSSLVVTTYSLKHQPL